MKNVAHVDKNLRLLQVFFIFVLPVLLLYFNILPASTRMFALLFSAILILGIVRKEKWEAKDFGFRVDNFRDALLPYILFTSVGVFAIMLFSKKIGLEPIQDWFFHPHFLYLFLIVSALQELAFRSFLIPILRNIFPDRVGVILINALLFALIHIIYPIPEYSLPLALIGGIGFAVMYMKYPNFYLVALSHSTLNFFAVLYGFFVILAA